MDKGESWMSDIADILDKVKDRVERLLELHPEARNNDLLLQWIYCFEYLKLDMPILPKKLLSEQPSLMESIRRVRQKIQNEEKLYPPTDLSVAKKRGWAEEEWRRYFA
jgi:hypothetical protein